MNDEAPRLDPATYQHRLDLVRSRWNERADWWDEMSEENAQGPNRPVDLARTIAALRLEPGDQLLDAGCGSGQFAVAFAERGLRVTAIDVSPEMLARARQHAASRGVQVTFLEGDMSRVAGSIARFDAIHARVSLHFAPDLKHTLLALRHALKPGGRLYASVPGALSPIYRNAFHRFLDAQEDMAYVTPRDLERVLTALGWQILDQWGDFGQSASDEGAGVTAEQAAALPLPLQQAAATTWAFIAR